MSLNPHDDNPGLEPDYGRRMSHTEAVALCRYAKAACPQQAFDQYTPDAWSDLLGDLRFEDCQEALRWVVQRQPFVSPAEIRARVKAVRLKRIGDYGPLPNPPEDLTAIEARDWSHAFMRQVGDGDLVLTEEQRQAKLPPWMRRPAIESGRTNAIPVEAITDHASRARAGIRESVSTIAAKPEPEPAPLTSPADRLREPEPAATTTEDA